MKWKKYLITALLLMVLIVSSQSAFAQEADPADTLYDESIESITDALPDSVEQYLYKDDLRESGGVLNTFSELFNDIIGNFKGLLSEPLRLFGMLSAILVVTAAIRHYGGEDDTLGGNNAVSLVGALALSAAVSTTVNAAVSAAMTAVSGAEQFVTGFIPVYAGILVSSGQVSSAAIYGGSIVAVTTAVSSVITLFIKPLTGVMLGLGIVTGMDDNGMDAVVDAIRKTVVWTMGIMTTVFIGLVSLQSLVSAQSDNLALRTTKYLVGNSIPLIGSSVSEAVATVSASFGVIRGSVGSAGIIAICAIFIPALLRLLLSAAAISVAGMIGDVVGADRLAKALRAVRGAVDIVTAVLAFYFVALIVCTAIMINIGG